MKNGTLFTEDKRLLALSTTKPTPANSDSFSVSHWNRRVSLWYLCERSVGNDPRLNISDGWRCRLCSVGKKRHKPSYVWGLLYGGGIKTYSIQLSDLGFESRNYPQRRFQLIKRKNVLTIGTGSLLDYYAPQVLTVCKRNDFYRAGSWSFQTLLDLRVYFFKIVTLFFPHLQRRFKKKWNLSTLGQFR